MASTVWKGLLTFGLVSFPVRLVRAARKDRIPLRYVRHTAALPSADGEGLPIPFGPRRSHLSEEEDEDAGAQERASAESVVSPVRQTYVSQDDGQSVVTADLERGYEVEAGKFAVIKPEELRRLRQPTSSAMEILRSVRMDEIDPIFLETSYYVVPGPGGVHPYSLFYRALKESNYATLAEVAMHGRQHVVVVRAGQTGLIAHTMYYVTEVRGSEEYSAQTGDVASKELDLARKFVEAIAGPFEPDEFTDRYREQLESLIASKEPVASDSAEIPAPTASGKVIDIMDALRRSLKKVQDEKSTGRKPAARVSESRKTRKRRG